MWRFLKLGLDLKLELVSEPNLFRLLKSCFTVKHFVKECRTEVSWKKGAQSANQPVESERKPTWPISKQTAPSFKVMFNKGVQSIDWSVVLELVLLLNRSFWLESLPSLCRVSLHLVECKQPLGMENGAISDAQITGSSWVTPYEAYKPSRARLNIRHSKEPYMAGGWVASSQDADPWLQVHLGNETFKVTRVATQGRHSYNEWVKNYKLQYSQDGVNFNYYKARGQKNDKVM